MITNMGIIGAFMVPHPPLIIPEIGMGEEQRIQKTIDAYQKVARKIGEQQPETIVLISPHQTLYADYFHISPAKNAKGDFGRFGVEKTVMEVTYDTVFVTELEKLAEKRKLPAGTLGEREKKLDHGTMVPLYFVNQYWQNYLLVRVGLSGLPFIKHYELGQYIKEIAETLNRRTVIIASGDLSHRLKEDGPYGYCKEGPIYDRQIMEIMETGNFEKLLEFSEDFCEKAGECGHRSFIIMAGALDETKVVANSLSYEGPFGVGYGICTYETQGKDDERDFKRQYEKLQRQHIAEKRKLEDDYVRLARMTVEEYTRTGRKPQLPSGLPEELYQQRAGVFVSIKENSRLRGCIGTIQAIQASIAEEIIENAISACSRDPRFDPIEPEELERLTISIDVLGDTEKITSVEMLDVKRYGVIVTKGRKRGLLLPNLEGVDTIDKQIAIAKQKAGIRLDEDVELERFEVVRH